MSTRAGSCACICLIAALAAYRKVMIDPLEVSFDKNWEENMKRSVVYRGRIDLQAISAQLAQLFREVARRELEEEGQYPLVDTPETDVLHLRPAITELYISAPDTQQPGRTHTLVMEAGHMILVAELRDSVTHALLARVVDGEEDPGVGGVQIASSVSNSAAASRIIRKWARALRTALDKARAAS